MAVTKDVVLKDVVSILNDLTGDWERGFDGEIGLATTLVGDLAFESIDVVQLAVALEEHFDREGLPFEKLLMVDGQYVEDLRVEQIVDFMCEQLAD